MASFKCPRWVVIVAIVLLTIAIIGLIAIPVSRWLSRNAGRSYVVMVDAGSSSSKLYVYSWPSDVSKDTPTDVKQEFFHRTTSKGVSSFAKEPENASKEIVRILRTKVLGENDEPAIIPPDQRATTPIYMGATAGMRLLEKRDVGISDRLLNRLRSDFSNLRLQVRNATKQMRIISGDEEALAGWISSNYLSNTLRNVGKDLSSPQKGTIGALDMGGASTQISFITTAPVGVEVSEIALYGRKFRVYQHSFLCFGKGEARNQIYAALWVRAGRSKKSTTIKNPCAQKGFSTTLSPDDFLQKPCFTDVTSSGLPDKKVNFKFTGSGDYEDCRRLTGALFKRDKCKYSRCSFAGIFQPKLPLGKFVAFSSYYFAMKFFNVTRDKTSRAEYQLRLKNFCQRNWNSVRNQYSGNIPSRFLNGYCFDGIYIDQVLINLGFTGNRWNDISFTGKIGKRKMSWPLGFILKESALIPLGLVTYNMAIPTYIGLIAIFVLILIISLLLLLGFVVSRWWTRRYSRARTDPPDAQA